jgi:hypothetical protein
VKALSIRQPWAFAILHLGKRVENRTWYTPFRGTFVLHAAKKWSRDEKEDLECFREEIVRKFSPAIPTVHLGYLVGTARLVDCVRPDKVPEGQESWATGDWCFVLDDVRIWKQPVKYKGMLGFFDVQPDNEDSGMPSEHEIAGVGTGL